MIRFDLSITLDYNVIAQSDYVFVIQPTNTPYQRFTLERLETQPAEDASRQILSLLETIAAPRRFVKRLAVRSAGKTVFVDIADVDWIEVAENYVKLHAGRASHLVQVAMNTLEKSLDPDSFLRIHRSILVNLGRIKELEPALHGEYVVTLQNGVRLRSGRTYHEKLKALAGNPF